MTLDVDLQLISDGANGITLTFAPFGTPGTVVNRILPDLDAASLDDLRRGDATPAVVKRLIESVSTWLVGTDLEQSFATAIDGGERLRLLLRMDRTLLATLSDVPVELITLRNALAPLIVHAKVDGIIRVRPELGRPLKAAPRDWPLRVLIVRSNPSDLGGAVPEALPIIQEIRNAAKDVPTEAVVIDHLSSEEINGDPVTWKRFRDALALVTPDILIYLGHGDLQRAFEETDPVGYLQFESDDGKGHEAIDSRKIAEEFHQHPVRVVVLAGCLTAANLAALDGAVQNIVKSELPRWLRGAEGVAQAIIDSEAGVELAVGMRDRLEVAQAKTFLVTFFESLLSKAPGDVERAVRAARYELWTGADSSPSWSSAVVFGKGPAPQFSFLAESPPRAAFSAATQAQLDGFKGLRRTIAKVFLEALKDRTPYLDALEAVAADEGPVIGRDSMIRPTFARAAPGSARIAVELVASVKLRRLAADVRIDGGDVTIDRLTADPRLAQAGFSFYRGDEDSGRSRFVLERDSSGSGTLAAGPLFTIDVTVAGVPPAIHEVSVTPTSTDSKPLIWAGMDILAVVP